MLRKINGRIRSGDEGFSLIEVLVVVVVIGILAAIAIPAFLGQRGRGQDTEAKSAVRSAASAAKGYHSDRESYIGMTPAALRLVEPSLNQGTAAGANFVVVVTDADTASLEVKSSTGNKFTIKDDAGVATRTCTTSGSGGCPSSSSW